MAKEANTVAIVGHVRPDGDAVGSALAMQAALEKNGKHVSVFFDGGVSDQFSYLEGFDKIMDTLPASRDFDLLIIVDMNATDRIGEFECLTTTSTKIMCIDHHIGNSVKGDLIISDTSYASCGEMIYEFFVSNEIKITKQIADALYTSVSTDTGCFMYPCTTARSHRIAAELMEIGCDVEQINYINFRVFDRRFINGLKQIGHDLTFARDGKISLTRLKKSNSYCASERHKFKQYISDIKGVKISILIAEDSENEFNVSLRSHGSVNVAAVAKEFGGGGHKHAAGFTIRGKYKKIARQIIKEVEKLLDENATN